MVKINNYYVGRKVRDICNNQNDNLELSNDVIPVVVINPNNAPAEVTPSFIKPNAKQVFKFGLVNLDATARQAQFATVSAIKAVYFVGYEITSVGTGLSEVMIFDGSSGTVSLPSPPTVDTTGILDFVRPAAASREYFISPIPIKLNTGLRIQNSAVASTNYVVTLFWIEEDLTP